MRLIDAKQLEKQAKEAFETLNPVLMGQTLRWIRKQKTIDAVPVVRCENCINKERAEVNANGFLICPASGMEITDDDFCSYGERKEGAENEP